MDQPHLIIVGGGLAGLSAGCYALRSGFRVTIVEHGVALGGVCTAWKRGAYTVDGCIHWLVNGPFTRIYEELEILPKVQLRVLERYVRYRDVQHPAWDISVTRDLAGLIEHLQRLCPEDREELARIRTGARAMVDVAASMGVPELQTVSARMSGLWGQRRVLGPLLHFRKPLREYVAAHVVDGRLRRFLTSLLPDTTPAFMLPWLLGYLERGYLSLPVGTSGAFRDGLADTYHRLGGEVLLHSTVDEVLVSGDSACGVLLANGRELRGDAVISTSSAPETVLRLLGGRYDASGTRTRLQEWRMFDPIVMVTFGVELPLLEHRGSTLFDGLVPFELGGVTQRSISARIMNGDPVVAPEGHSVVQTTLNTTYDYWAQIGARYENEKALAAETVLAQLDPYFPGLRAAVRMVDVATPLTYWNMARSWRGAFEGWMPSGVSMQRQTKKTLVGLGRFYMAGQWVEPGGGVPTAVLSGRQAVALLCAEVGREFASRPPSLAAGSG